MKDAINRLKKDKNNKIMIGIIVGIAILLLILVYFLFFKSYSKNTERCLVDYKIGSKSFIKAENKIKEIDSVKDVDIYLNVCIIKIVVELKEDVELNTIKSKMTESLKEFDKELLENYDLELFIKSDNKESNVYPIIVSKHKSQNDFYWE